MPKMITITATNKKTGKSGSVEVLYPLNLDEAIQMESKNGSENGEHKVYLAYLRDKAIIDQRTARPADEPVDGEDKPAKKRLSMLDRIAAAE
jgi:hypothetical protein